MLEVGVNRSIKWHKKLVAALSRAMGNSVHSFRSYDDGVLQIFLFGELSHVEVACIRDLVKHYAPGRWRVYYRKRSGHLVIRPLSRSNRGWVSDA